MKSWKHAEYRIAEILDGKRVGVTGKSTNDVEHEWLSVEVKYRKQLPQWLKDALDQAIKSARENQLAIAVLHERYSKYDDAIVLIRLKDFRDWFGDS